MSVTQVGVWAPLRAAGIVSRLTVLTMKRSPHHTIIFILKMGLKSETFAASPRVAGEEKLEFNFM